MKRSKYIVALDEGTTSARAVLIDSSGKIVGKIRSRSTTRVRVGSSITLARSCPPSLAP